MHLLSCISHLGSTFKVVVLNWRLFRGNLSKWISDEKETKGLYIRVLLRNRTNRREGETERKKERERERFIIGIGSRSYGDQEVP